MSHISMIFVYCPFEAVLGTKLRSFNVVIYDARSHMCSQGAVIFLLVSGISWLLLVSHVCSKLKFFMI
jgi:hypothetical protein